MPTQGKVAVTVRVEGNEELEERIRALAAALAAEFLEQAATEGAKLVAEEASRRAPRRTGTLATHIGVKTDKKTSGLVTVAVGPDKDAFYGLFVERGTSKMRARPFLRPALDAKQPEVEQVIRDKLRELIQGVVES